MKITENQRKNGGPRILGTVLILKEPIVVLPDFIPISSKPLAMLILWDLHIIKLLRRQVLL